MYPRCPRSDLLRALSRSTPGQHNSGSGIHASNTAAAGTGRIPAVRGGIESSAGADFGAESHGSRHSGWIFPLRCGSGLLLAIRQGTRAPGDFRADDRRPERQTCPGMWIWCWASRWDFFYFYQIIDAVRRARAFSWANRFLILSGLAQNFGFGGSGEKIEATKVPTGAADPDRPGCAFPAAYGGAVRVWPASFLVTDPDRPRAAGSLPRTGD